MTSRNRASCTPTNKGKSTFQRHIEAFFTITHVSRVLHSLVLAHQSSRLCPESFFQQSPCRELFRLEAQVTRQFKSSRHPSIPPNICLIAAFHFPRNGCRKLLNRRAPLCVTKTFRTVSHCWKRLGEKLPTPWNHIAKCKKFGLCTVSSEYTTHVGPAWQLILRCSCLQYSLVNSAKVPLCASILKASGDSVSEGKGLGFYSHREIENGRVRPSIARSPTRAP